MQRYRVGPRSGRRRRRSSSTRCAAADGPEHARHLVGPGGDADDRGDRDIVAKARSQLGLDHTEPEGTTLEPDDA